MEENVIQKINNIIESIKNGTDSIENYKNQLTTLKLKTGWTLAHELASQKLFTGLSENKSVLTAATEVGWTVAHEMARNGFLFTDLETLSIKARNETTVFEVIVDNNYKNIKHLINKDFLQNIIDNEFGNTVAHILAKRNKFPEKYLYDREILRLTNKKGESVAYYLCVYTSHKYEIVPENYDILMINQNKVNNKLLPLVAQFAVKKAKEKDLRLLPEEWLFLQISGYEVQSLVHVAFSWYFSFEEQKNLVKNISYYLNIFKKHPNKSKIKRIIINLFGTILLKRGLIKLWLSNQSYTRQEKISYLFDSIFFDDEIIITKEHIEYNMKKIKNYIIFDDVVNYLFMTEPLYKLKVFELVYNVKAEVIEKFFDIFKEYYFQELNTEQQKLYPKFVQKIVELSEKFYNKMQFSEILSLNDNFDDILNFLNTSEKWKKYNKILLTLQEEIKEKIILCF